MRLDWGRIRANVVIPSQVRSRPLCQLLPGRLDGSRSTVAARLCASVLDARLHGASIAPVVKSTSSPRMAASSVFQLLG